MNSQDIIETLQGYDLDIQSMLYALEDGEALASLGITDDDQEAVEEAYDILRKLKI